MAGEWYKKSLKLNPLLWKSYEALCQLGKLTDIHHIFMFYENSVLIDKCHTCKQKPQMHTI